MPDTWYIDGREVTPSRSESAEIEIVLRSFRDRTGADFFFEEDMPSNMLGNHRDPFARERAEVIRSVHRILRGGRS